VSRRRQRPENVTERQTLMALGGECRLGDLRRDVGYRHIAVYRHTQWQHVDEMADGLLLPAVVPVEMRNAENHLVCGVHTGQIGGEGCCQEGEHRRLPFPDTIDEVAFDHERVAGATPRTVPVTARHPGREVRRTDI